MGIIFNTISYLHVLLLFLKRKIQDIRKTSKFLQRGAEQYQDFEFANEAVHKPRHKPGQ